MDHPEIPRETERLSSAAMASSSEKVEKKMLDNSRRQIENKLIHPERLPNQHRLASIRLIGHAIPQSISSNVF